MGSKDSRWPLSESNPGSLPLLLHHAMLVHLLVNGDRSRASTRLLGLSPWRCWSQKETVLPYVQRFQTRKVPSLFCVQQMCTKHGSSLSMDKQLRWLLESQVLHAHAHLCAAYFLFHCGRVNNKCLWKLWMVCTNLLRLHHFRGFFKGWLWPSQEAFFDRSLLCICLCDWLSDISFHQVPRVADLREYDHHWKPRQKTEDRVGRENHWSSRIQCGNETQLVLCIRGEPLLVAFPDPDGQWKATWRWHLLAYQRGTSEVKAQQKALTEFAFGT